MRRFICLAMMTLGTICGAARADHFAIELTASAGKESRTVYAQAQGTSEKPTRPVLHVSPGTRVKVKWKLTSKHARDTFKNVLVHFFVVKEDKAGQRVIPDLRKGTIVENALTMDFPPGDKTEGELSFAIEAPGAYLLRLETVGAAVGKDGHEHFAALDVVAP